jgi:hypothetical protein
MSYTHTHEELDEAMVYLDLVQQIAPRKAPAAFDPRSIAIAPLLEDWLIEEFDAGDCEIFWGYVSGHPHLADGLAHTSAIVWLDEALGWARTLYRFYRIGARKHLDEPINTSGAGADEEPDSR